jgi:hypothetical protein
MFQLRFVYPVDAHQKQQFATDGHKQVKERGHGRWQYMHENYLVCWETQQHFGMRQALAT